MADLSLPAALAFAVLFTVRITYWMTEMKVPSQSAEKVFPENGTVKTYDFVIGKYLWLVFHSFFPWIKDKNKLDH